GSATKGVMINAPVKAYEILADGDLSAAVGTATTDSKGDYSMTLDSAYKGGPLRIVIEGGSGVTMVCDIPSGCGSDVLFGQAAPLSSDFRLSAVVVAPIGNTVSVHVTPLTDLADKLAEKKGYSAGNVAAANDIIRQAFQLGSDITSVKPVDITNADSIAAGSADAKKMALLTAAILTAADAQGSGDSLEAKLAAFAKTVGADGGLVVNDTGTQPIVSVRDILAAAATVSAAAKTKAADDNKSIDLGAVDTALALSLSEAEAKPQSDVPTLITPIDTVTKSDVAKTKALAADLRAIATSSQLRDGTVQFGQQIQGAFGDQLDLISTVANSDLGNLLRDTGY